MKTLTTGINGFIGSYLSDYLKNQGDQISGVYRQKNQAKEGIKAFFGDLNDKEFISKVIQSEKFDRIFHLAAQSSIPYSFKEPRETITTNINGTLNLLEAVRELKENISLVSFGSSAEYGKTAADGKPMKESSPLSPSSPYAVSKVAAGQLVEIYREAYDLNAFHVRPFAIIGLGKVGDAISDFARGIVAIEKGTKEELLVGNISHNRDFLDVRDAVRAVELVSREKTSDHSIYNICSGVGRKLEDLLNEMVRMSTAKVVVKTDPEKTRPADDPIIVGDPGRIFSLGFKPMYTIKETLADILNYWRDNYSNA